MTLPPHIWQCLCGTAYNKRAFESCPTCGKPTAIPYAEDNPSREIPDAQPPKQEGALGRDHEGEAQSTGRPLVRFTLFRVRLFDVDAKWASVKDLLDGCATAGLIHGDREDQISLEVRQIKVNHFKEEETLIEVFAPNGPATASVSAARSEA